MTLFNKITLDNDIIEYKKYKKTQIITKDSFKEYCKELEKEEKYISIIRNTKLKKIDKDKISEDDEVLLVDDKYYKVSESKEKITAGYISVGTDKFIRVERSILIPILLLLLLIGFIVININFKPSNINLDDSAIDWNGENPNTKGTPNQENIELPGFYKFVATEKAKSIPLYNPTNNTVYFTYSVFQITESSIVKTFDSEIDAQTYIKNNEVNFTEEKDGNTYKLINKDTEKEIDSVYYYKIIKSNNQYSVIREKLQLLSCTNMIKPGKQVLWNVYEYLSKGEYNLRFKIRTFDIETGAECYGGFLAVEGIVE